MEMTAHNSAVKALAFSNNDSNLLMTGGGINDKTIKVWDLINFSPKKSLKSSNQICGINWDNDQQIVIGSGKSVEIWRKKGWKKIGEAEEHEGRILGIKECKKENFICSLGSDETMRFWRWKERKEKKQKPSHNFLFK